MADNILKVPKLIGSPNWDLWSIRMESILIEKGYDEVLTTSISIIDPTSGEYNRLKALSQKATAYIKLALADGPLLQTRHITDPCKLWNTLQGLYEPKGFSSEFLIVKELINTTLVSSKGNLELYLQNIKRLVNSLEARNIKLPNSFIVALLLNNLSSDYKYIVTIITQSIRESSNVDIDAIFSQLIDESRRLKSIKGDKAVGTPYKEDRDIEMSLSTNNKKGYKNNTRDKKKCSYCSRVGHLEETCFKKHPHLAPSKKVSMTSPIASPNRELVLSTSKQTSENREKLFQEFVLDSGASIHTCSNIEFFNSIKPTNTTIKWGNNTSSYIKASGIGDISLFFNSTNTPVTIKDVLYVPELEINLLSLSCIASKGVNINFLKNEVNMVFNNSLLAKGYYKDRVSLFKVFRFKDTIPKDLSQNNTSTSDDTSVESSVDLATINPWHLRLGHIGNKALNALPNNVEGVKDNLSKIPIKDCETCIKSSFTRQINKELSPKPKQYLEKVTIDIGGPIKPISHKGYRYYITFIDNATGYLDVMLLKNRENLKDPLEIFIKRAEKQSNYKVKRLHADNEFYTKEIEELVLSKGIVFTYSAPYTPEQKGVGERINRTLFDKVRALLYTSNLARKYWNEALLASVYLYNRTPHSSYSYKTPFELKSNRKPNISNIKTFGSLAYRKEPKEFVTKLDARASPYYLIGYGHNQYKLLDPKTSKTMWARDVYIIENKFYKDKILDKDLDLLIDLKDPITSKNLGEEIGDLSIDKPIEPVDNDATETIEYETEDDEVKYSYDDFYSQLLENIILITSKTDEPTTYSDVLRHPNKDDYLKAIQVELEQLNKNNTWTLVPRPVNTPVLKGRWVFSKKLKADGSLDKYKARWVVKGFMQQYGVNFKETFAGTTKPIVIRLLFAIATIVDLEVYKWDIKQAFPNAPIDTTIYVEQPIVNKSNNKNVVCRLNKALYGLKQAARQWQQHLVSILVEFGYKPLISDTSVFIHSTEPIVLAVYVDDILVFTSKLDLADELYNHLTNSKLEVSNLGEAKEFLGIEIIRDRPNKSIRVTQKGFITNIINRYNKSSLKPSNSPYINGLKLDKAIEQAPKEDVNKFQKEIGALIYITLFTRPDLTYPINFLARFMSNPHKDHFRALDKVWSYLIRTKDYSLNLDQSSTIANNKINLISYVDADWGGDPVSRKSTTGFINLLGASTNSTNFPISWNSKLQKTVALSSCEAEYMAYKEAFKENMYINSLIKELSLFMKELFDNTKDIYTDSLSAIELAKNPLYHARTKHVDIRYHFIREKVNSKEINLVYCPTNQLLADGLTKAITISQWTEFIIGLGLST